MHDPLSVAFEIPNPFAKHYNPEARKRGDKFGGEWSHRPPLITIWHCDPERDGTDSSCQNAIDAREWSERCEAQAVAMARWAESGFGERYFDCADAPRVRLLTVGFDAEGPKENCVFHGVSAGDALALTVAAFQTIAWQLERRELTGRRLREAITFGSCPDAAPMFSPTLTKEQRVETFRRLIRRYLACQRPPWRTWRLHVWHWRIQVHPLQSLWRFLSKRCEICGGRFWPKDSVSSDWHGTRLWHSRCDESLANPKEPT